MQASPTRADRQEIGALYGLRALMVLFVVNYHIWQQGWLGQYANLFGTHVSFDYFTRSSYLFVDGMLLLSGFLLYLPYARALLGGEPRPSAHGFYRRRAARILPSYLAAVLVGLCLIALPQGAYQTPGAMWTDLFSHLTFTFMFNARTYLATPLGGALWTVAVEVQFYLLFPLLARGKRLWPAALAMAACGLAYRLYVYGNVPDTAMWINQLPAFLDVFAVGMLGAAGYCRLKRWLDARGDGAKLLCGLAAIVVFALAAWALTLVLRAQSAASAGGHEAIRRGQLMWRLPLAGVFLALTLAASFLPRAAAWLLGNRLMRFLSAISFNLYMYHQQLSVQIRLGWYTDALRADVKQQSAYTLLCFCAALLAAMAATYGVEKPCARLMNTAFDHMGRKRKHERPKTREI